MTVLSFRGTVFAKRRQARLCGTKPTEGNLPCNDTNWQQSNIVESIRAATVSK